MLAEPPLIVSNCLLAGIPVVSDGEKVPNRVISVSGGITTRIYDSNQPPKLIVDICDVGSFRRTISEDGALRRDKRAHHPND